MTTPCTLTDFVSWFTCAQSAVPMAEIFTMSIFFIFFLLLKTYPLRESLPTALFFSTFTAGVFYGMGLVSAALPIAGIVLTALSVVFLNSQNTT